MIPGRKINREHPPLTPDSDPIEDRVQHFADVDCSFLTRPVFLRDMRRNKRKFLVIQIAGVACGDVLGELRVIEGVWSRCAWRGAIGAGATTIRHRDRTPSGCERLRSSPQPAGFRVRRPDFARTRPRRDPPTPVQRRPRPAHAAAHDRAGRAACPRRTRLSHKSRLRIAQAWYSWHCAAICPTRRARRQP
jgi:hypothetical protein